MSELAENRRRAAGASSRHGAHGWAVRLAFLALLLTPPLFANDYVQYVINLILVYSLVAVGFNIVLGYLGQLAFANAAFFGIGAYSVAIQMTHLGLPFWVALLPTGVIGLLAGALVGLPALRLKGYYLAIVTLVFGELMRWAYIHGDELTMGSGGLAVPKATVLGFTLNTDAEKYYLFLAVVIAVVWMTNNVLRSRIGRTWVAIHENELATASLGLSPALYKVAAFAWSGFVVGMAGALFAVLVGRVIPDSFDLHQLLLHFAIVMIGGLGSILGSILGAAVLTAAPEILRNFPGLEEIVFSLLLIGVLLFMPRGINGLLVSRWRRLRERLWRE